jgi:hypothetical protein
MVFVRRFDTRIKITGSYGGHCPSIGGVKSLEFYPVDDKSRYHVIDLQREEKC